MGQPQQFVPGMRLEIREAEWRLTRLDHSSDGGYLLGCTELSELVRGRETQFLSCLEDEICIRDPASTELVDDLSQGYRAGLSFQLEPTLRARIEFDVLVAQALGITSYEMKITPHVQFSTMRQNEDDTWYDARGRIVFTPSKGLVGVGLPREANRRDLDNDIHYSIESPDRTEYGIALGWEDIQDLQKGDVRKTYLDDTLPDGPWEKTVAYHAPFTRPDREKDYEEAWAFFENEKNLA